MALQEKHRSTIYQRLSPIVGEEATEALLAQLPARDDDEPITKAHLDRRFAELDVRFAELDVRFEQLRTEMHRIQNRGMVAGGAMLALAVSVLSITLG